MGSSAKGKEMAKNLVLSGQNFDKLVLDLRKIIDAGRARAQAAANFELMRTYWNCGARIARERLTENSGYGESVMERLANELHADRTTLVRCVLYHQYYPKGVSQNIQLSWSHMRELLSVKDDAARQFYETTAIEKKWTRDELVKAIQADHFGEDPTKGNGKPPKQLKRPAGEPFIYRSTILRVLDGDTLLVRLDLGFEVLIGQRIRLAEVDAPPLQEDGGEEAFAYVRDQMAKSKKIVIRTSKEDLHGRFVGHVFYSLDERMEWGRVYRDGRWLNQELLDRGLARVY
jgi:endonuclease YncB( thermonuclease family)